MAVLDGLFSRSSSSQDLRTSPSGALAAQSEAQQVQHSDNKSAPLPGVRPVLQTANGLIPKPCRVVDTSFASFSLFTETLYDPYE